MNVLFSRDMKLGFPLVATLVASPGLAAVPAPATFSSEVGYLLTAVSGGRATVADYSDASGLVLGPTGTPLPSAGSVAYFLDNYLSPTPTVPVGVMPQVSGFTGNPDNVLAFSTPEQTSGDSYLQGDAEVVHELLLRYDGLMAGGDDSPLYLFGYSQSATILTAVDSHLNDPEWIEYVLEHGGHSTDVSGYASEIADLGSIAPYLRLVLIGNPAAAPTLSDVDAGNTSSGFDNAGFTQPWLTAFGFGGTIDGQNATVGSGYVGGTGDDSPILTNGYAMAGQNTNLDLSPTAVYTIAGDNWAQATSFLCVPNLFSAAHLAYLGASVDDFHYVDTIGNVDYFETNSTFNLFTALWDSMIAALGGL